MYFRLTLGLLKFGFIYDVYHCTCSTCRLFSLTFGLMAALRMSLGYMSLSTRPPPGEIHYLANFANLLPDTEGRRSLERIDNACRYLSTTIARSPLPGKASTASNNGD